MVETIDIIDYFKKLQDDICRGLEELDGQGRFHEDIWNREEGGGGRTRIIHGQEIEKGGVNFSHVHGEVTPMMKKMMNMEGTKWLASRVSIVLHPVSPMVPIIHMNVRYFELDGGKDWWFGGGIDLTPHYIDRELARKFHSRMKAVCDEFRSD
ncbi:MAG: coproporphyrinogen III oxidase, partial [Romboutsia sp.]|nr:coproporphyrinogen III oxidase [Romboutsia sp.]